MKNFIRFQVQSKLKQDQLFELTKRSLPEFDWRRGDSDAQGLYVSGLTTDLIQIQFWFDDGFVDTTVSFRSVEADSPRKEALITRLEKDIFSAMGRVLKRQEND